MAKIAAPKNGLIDSIQKIIDYLIDGVAVDVIVSAVTAMQPWLGYPIIRTIFRALVEKLAELVNTNLFAWGVKIALRVQSGARKDEYNEALLPIIGGSPTDEEIQKARDAAIRLIERNRP